MTGEIRSFGAFLWRTFVREADMVDRVAEGLGVIAAGYFAWTGTTQGWLSTLVVTVISSLGRRACTVDEVTPRPPGWSYKDVPASVPNVAQSIGKRAGAFQLRPGQHKQATLIRYDMDGWIEVNTEYEWKRISLTGGKEYVFAVTGQSEAASRETRKFKIRGDSQQAFVLEQVT